MKYVLRMKTTQTRDFSKHISLIYKRPGCSAFCNCYLVYFLPRSLQSLCISAHLSYLPDNYKTFNVWFTAQLFQCLVSFISRFCNLLPIWGIMPELQTHQLHWACTSQRGYFPRKAWLQMFISVWHYKKNLPQWLHILPTQLSSCLWLMHNRYYCSCFRCSCFSLLASITPWLERQWESCSFRGALIYFSIKRQTPKQRNRMSRGLRKPALCLLTPPQRMIPPWS